MVAVQTVLRLDRLGVQGGIKIRGGMGFFAFLNICFLTFSVRHSLRGDGGDVLPVAGHSGEAVGFPVRQLCWMGLAADALSAAVCRRSAVANGRLGVVGG